MQNFQVGSISLVLIMGFSLFVSVNADVNDVCEIQERLTDLGLDSGPIDGVVGKKTREAVGSFLGQVATEGQKYSQEEVLSFLRRAHRIDQASPPPKPTTRPTNGKIFHSLPNSIAPFQIKTADQGYDYYVKLSEVNSGQATKTFYVHSGSTVDMKVPLGIMEMKYATGIHWHGKNCLFGMDTIYNKADSTFDFKRIGDQVSGYTVELILQVDGNLATKKISIYEW